MSDAILELDGVEKVFEDGTRALAPTDLVVARGSFLAILGPSGCGKSTLLRVVAGLVPASGGRVRWAGGGAPRLGFVFQEPTLMPWATIGANVALPLRLAGVSAAERRRRAEAALESVGLGDQARRWPRMLSGGMRMRASIARALVEEPDMLLLDEPFAALDETTRFRLNDDLAALCARRGMTALFVTHSVFESVYLASRLIVLARRPGRIHADFDYREPSPREPVFRTSAAYAARCGDVGRALDAALAA